MNYKVTAVKDGYNENIADGYKLFEYEKQKFYAWMNNGQPDPREWDKMLPYFPFEHGEPIYTREYCEHHGINRDNYDTITILD